MLKDYPDHHDAELVLRMYELRREPVMREARSKIRQFLPKTYDELAAITKADHPLNAAFRQTSTYWEMVFGIARHGIVHADFLAESSGEGILFYAKVKPYIDRYRQEVSPRAFRNVEWLVSESAVARDIFTQQTQRIASQLAAK
jgi:adenine/guanine phosphoribosyltransferase-like PRPP-binding protein